MINKFRTEIMGGRKFIRLHTTVIPMEGFSELPDGKCKLSLVFLYENGLYAVVDNFSPGIRFFDLTASFEHGVRNYRQLCEDYGNKSELGYGDAKVLLAEFSLFLVKRYQRGQGLSECSKEEDK